MGNLLRLKWTLKAKVIMVVVTAVLATAAVIVSVSLYVMKRDIKTLIGSHQYTTISTIATALDESFHARRIALRSLSQGLPPQARRDIRQLQIYLAGHTSLTEMFFNVSVFGANGDLIANFIDTGSIGRYNITDREYMRRTLALKQGVISEPLRSQMSGRAVVLMTEPVFDDSGKVVMVFVGSIDLQQANFLGQFTDARIGKTGFIFILTSKGIIVDHIDKGRILQHADSAGGKSGGTERALQGFEGSMEGMSRANQPALFAYKRMKTADWIIGSLYLKDEAFLAIRDIQNKALLVSLALSILAGWLAWLIMSRLIDPLHRLLLHIQKIRAAGTYDEVPLSYRADEIGDLGSAFNSLMRERKDAEIELDQARVNLESMNKTLERLALEDDLTGLANRRRFDLSLQEEFSRAVRGGRSLALVMIDVDHFKQYNDIYGHLAGDQCLRKVGRVIRAQQTRPGDLMARYGGEEVAVLLPGADEAGAIAVAERIRLAVRQLGLLHEGNDAGIVTVSAGVSAFVPIRDIDAPDKLMRAADKALYLAKAQGRDRTRSSTDLPQFS
ncbi:GGDEF domain-containing protein [Herbaspirillum sp. RV1423]|uniref:sensor domain-containing diguanylate cyclase n=1 Tax=Herbaspirillum sp. RV1423 TaxID=1443993 RepID=UPI00055465F2|nr:GGDEF domain-containing protein [Herbaspirillum sp. RV1423]